MTSATLTDIASGEPLDPEALAGDVGQIISGRNGSTVIEMRLPDEGRQIRRIFHVREGIETVRQVLSQR